VDAVNEGAIYKFLTKPWDDAVLTGVVREAAEVVHLRRENERLHALVQTQNDELLAANLSLQKTMWDEVGARALLEALPVGVLAVREDGSVAVANRETRRILGVSASFPPQAPYRAGLVVREGFDVDAPGWKGRAYAIWEG
jgi:PAS domain-containing protein